MPSNSTTSSPDWPAELQLTFARRDSRTILAHRQHVGPLIVQRPFYPEDDICHVYVVHPPGGIAGGDRLRLDATLECGSHAVITTPAATKFYRTLPDRHALLRQELRLQDAALEWLPQETILFRDAQAATATVVHITKQSHFIGWEITCYGRPASDEYFDRGIVQQHFEVWLDEQPIFLDHLRINGGSSSMHANWGMGGNTTLGTLLAYPATVDDLEAARTHDMFACTLIDGVLSCRLVCHDGQTAKDAHVRLWQTLRPRILKREAVLPRIWAT